MTHLEGKLLSPMAWETAAPAHPDGMAPRKTGWILAAGGGPESRFRTHPVAGLEGQTGRSEPRIMPPDPAPGKEQRP
jgi:hypothetical protein